MGKVTTLETVVTKARTVHGNTYEYLELIKEPGKPVKVKCVCKSHGEFALRAARHYTEGKGCPKCAVTTTILEFVYRASEVHEGKYEYNKVEFTLLKNKVTITCPAHGEFSQAASEHLAGKGCNKCGILKRAEIKTNNTEKFVTKAKYVHGELYDYSKSIYVKAIDKLIITCKKHGDFSQQPIQHTSGQGCPRCSGLYGKTTEGFVEDANRVHKGKYTYLSTVYEGALMPVTILCSTHGTFKQIASNHLRGSGCPSCSISGFDPDKPGFLYYLKITTASGTLYKIGITNLTVQQRFSVAERKTITVLSITKYSKGSDAYSEEQRILTKYKKYKYKGENILNSGNTEILTKDVLGEDV